VTYDAWASNEWQSHWHFSNNDRTATPRVMDDYYNQPYCRILTMSGYITDRRIIDYTTTSVNGTFDGFHFGIVSSKGSIRLNCDTGDLIAFPTSTVSSSGAVLATYGTCGVVQRMPFIIDFTMMDDIFIDQWFFEELDFPDAFPEMIVPFLFTSSNVSITVEAPLETVMYDSQYWIQERLRFGLRTRHSQLVRI
jgi:hypothetical protein